MTTLTENRRMLRWVLSLLVVTSPAVALCQDTSLAGVWYDKRWFGPDLRGEFRVQRTASGWQASIAGRAAEYRGTDDRIEFDFPSGATFRGHLDAAKARIVGHWIQPATVVTGERYATPLALALCGVRLYCALVVPLEDTYTVYLQAKPRPDGRLGVFVRNPERNQGRFIPAPGAQYIVRRGDTVMFRNARDSSVATTVLRDGVLPVSLTSMGFDLARIQPDSFTNFYPRGRPASSYVYRVPPARADGWRVANVRDVGLSPERISELMRWIVAGSTDSANAYRPHGILVARHGKLVVEEYFFGEHAEKPHDTRSASKTLVNIVLGAAMERGIKVSPAASVYSTMGLVSDTLDPRKRAMTIQHLLTMTSGLDCDDFNDPERPGSEDTFRAQTRTDWITVVLGLAMVRPPGSQAVYCSINPFLASAVLSHATGEWFPDLAWELVGAPLQMSHYFLNLTPQGEAYMGGGAYFRGRDFLKLAQLYANRGVWNGHRVVSEAWINESIKPRFAIGPTINYGYLWWTSEFTHKGKRTLAHMASGNGGNFSIFFPALDLVIVSLGGNYSDRAGFTMLTEIIPKYILPSVVE
jgi:CubicO group peptidase (beta-lactamase class C family)